jgi:hypothetical protein
MIQYPWVGGGLGWFYYLYHKNINKTLILQNFYDDFLVELQMGNKSSKKVKIIQNCTLNSSYRFVLVCYASSQQILIGAADK